MNVGGWYGFHAPAGTPKPVVDRLAQALEQAMATEEVKNSLASACVDIGFMGVQEFDAFVRDDVTRWRRTVELVGKN